VPILEQRLSAKLEEISRDSPSVAGTLSVIHQQFYAELNSRKSEATSQNLTSLKAEILNETLAKLEQPTSHALIAQEARIQRLKEQAQRKEAECQETLSSLRSKELALTEELVKAGQAASAQDERFQRFEEQARRKEAECQETLSSLRAMVQALTEELVKAQTAQEAMLRSIEERSQKSEADAQQTLTSPSEKVEALTVVHLNAEEVKSVKTAQDAQIQGLNMKAEAAAQQTLNIPSGAVEAIGVWSQCKQAQEPMFQATSEKTQAVLPHTLVSDSTSPPTTTEETKQSRPPPQHTPTFFYSCQTNTNQLHRVNLLTGEKTSHEVPHYQFKLGCRWSELPGGSLLITGGFPGVRDAVRVDVGTFAVSPQRPMRTRKSSHATVYHSQYVYVLGYSKCERYSCAKTRWKVLPALPVAGESMSGVEVENSVYALGGYKRDTVQKLSLDSLTWQLMQLKLPQAAMNFACFKKDTEVYLVIGMTMYSFTPLQVKAVKTLDRDIDCYSSYYSRGTLYYECGMGIYSY
jgi:hypothetical protein